MFCFAVFEVIIVVVEFCSGVSGRGETKGDWQVLFADNPEEDVVSISSVLVECFFSLANPI
jgi:hypothetical protein